MAAHGGVAWIPPMMTYSKRSIYLESSYHYLTSSPICAIEVPPFTPMYKIHDSSTAGGKTQPKIKNTEVLA